MTKISPKRILYKNTPVNYMYIDGKKLFVRGEVVFSGINIGSSSNKAGRITVYNYFLGSSATIKNNSVVTLKSIFLMFGDKTPQSWSSLAPGKSITSDFLISNASAAISGSWSSAIVSPPKNGTFYFNVLNLPPPCY